MAYQLTPFIILYASIFALTLSLALYASLRYARYDRRLSVLAFAVLMFAVAFWELTSILLEMVVSPDLKLIAQNVANVTSVPFYNFSLLFFSLSFTEHRKWIKWAVGAFALNIAVLGLVLLFNPEFLYETRGLVTRGPVTILGFTFEEYVLHARDLNYSFSVYGFYSYLVAVGSAGILIRYILGNADDLRTPQSVLIGVGIGTPVVLNGMELFGVIPIAVSVTELGFGVTAMCFAVAIFNYQLFEIPPISRQQLVGLIDEPLVFVNSENEIIYSNPSARQVFDVESGWKGMDATRFFAPQARNIQPPDVDGPTGDSTIEQVGTDRYFKVKSTTAQAPTGEAGGRIISLREVTELKRTNKRLDQFAAMVSHDLRTPLNNAAIQTDRLADERSDGRIGSIKAELDRMEAIIDDMLRLARAGEDIEATEACSLRELVQEVFETVQTDGAKLDCRVGDATVEADPVRLFQLLENLFRNALDHNDTPLTVRVGTVGASGDGADPDVRAGFFIEDDGEGLSDSDRDEIFEHGYTTRRDGNGYGLSIVRSIVEAHGWEIHVTDGADGGARFEITGVETA